MGIQEEQPHQQQQQSPEDLLALPAQKIPSCCHEMTSKHLKTFLSVLVFCSYIGPSHAHDRSIFTPKLIAALLLIRCKQQPPMLKATACQYGSCLRAIEIYFFAASHRAIPSCDPIVRSMPAKPGVSDPVPFKNSTVQPSPQSISKPVRSARSFRFGTQITSKPSKSCKAKRIFSWKVARHEGCE